MYSEKELLLDIKKQFDWPVDLERYQIQGKEGRYWDGNSYFNELPTHIQKRVHDSRIKIEYAKKQLLPLTRLPWVRMILLTGSVASLNAKERDDIDVWLIVDDRRIWLTRTLDYLLYTFKGVRRLASHGVDVCKIDNKFCFNMYTTPNGSAFKHSTTSYAMQFIDAIPLYEKSEGEYFRLIQKNNWVSLFFPTWVQATLKSVAQSKIAMTEKKRSFLDPITDLFEYVAGFFMQLKMYKKLRFAKADIFVEQFTTWGSARILSSYEKTKSERSKKTKQSV
jgi:predicted nucleotidyltransferase